MSNNFKTCPALLYLLLLLGKASCNYFESELSLANDKTSIVRKCCPKEKIRHHRRPLHCCQDGLFRDEVDGYLLKECADQGVSSDSIVKTIRCAQQEIHGENAVEICNFAQPCKGCEMQGMTLQPLLIYPNTTLNSSSIYA
uniref:Uncharacterized protein n=1 Tax=Meloidogyne incognita TaxID=6306 RepID=A0A914LS08_MELIC